MKNISRYIKYNGELDVNIHVSLGYRSDCIVIDLVTAKRELLATVYVRDEKYKDGKELRFETDEECKK